MHVRKLRHDRRGAGLVTVLVAMFVVLAMGAALLFIAFTGLQIKTTERKSEQNFYETDDVLNVLRAGIQEAVTDSIASAYTTVLNEYSSAVRSYENEKRNAEATPGILFDKTLESVLNERFQAAFRDSFKHWKKVAADGSVYPLFQTPDTAPQIDGDWLDYVLGTLPGARVSMGALDETETNTAFLIRDVTVENTGDEGFVTRLRTDIRVAYPPFSYRSKDYATTEVTDLALIADGGLFCAASSSVSGDAYVGAAGLRVYRTGVTFTYKRGTLVCGSGNNPAGNGHILVGYGNNDPVGAGGGAFAADAGTVVWAPGVDVAAAASFRFGGSELYVADDLSLSGAGADVTLSGAYYGFGYDQTEPDKSSSIVVSGQGARLNMAGVTDLLLAGRTFISADANLSMGQSLAVKSDQLAYLAPGALVNVVLGDTAYTSNPCFLPSALSTADKQAVTAACAAIRTELLRRYPQLRDAGGLPSFSVRPVYVQQSHAAGSLGTIVFFFTQFSDPAAANAYFQAYFAETNNAAAISAYLQNYLTLYSASSSSVGTAGATYAGTVNAAGVNVALRDSLDGLDSVADFYSKQYANLAATMMSGVSGTDTPYAYHINTAKVASFCGANAGKAVFEFRKDGATVALLVDQAGTFTFDRAAYPNVRAILCTGDLQFNSDFDGMAVAGGLVTLNGANLHDAATDLLDAVSADDGRTEFRLFLRHLSGTAGGGTGAAQDDAPTWEVERLVTCVNWGKNDAAGG